LASLKAFGLVFDLVSHSDLELPKASDLASVMVFDSESDLALHSDLVWPKEFDSESDLELPKDSEWPTETESLMELLIHQQEPRHLRQHLEEYKQLLLLTVLLMATVLLKD